MRLKCSGNWIKYGRRKGYSLLYNGTLRGWRFIKRWILSAAAFRNLFEIKCLLVVKGRRELTLDGTTTVDTSCLL